MIYFPWTATTVPHFVLEVARGCNIVCRACYKRKASGVASLDQIERELDVAQAARRVHTVSIAGAEPTLHSQLPEIVARVRRRGLRAALITNGLLLGDNLLDRLESAGLDVVMVHVDEGQERPDLPPDPRIEDVNELRLRITRRVAAHGMDAGLCATIHRNTLCNLPALVRLVFESEHIGFLFATQQVNVCAAATGLPTSPTRTTNREVAQLLADSLGIEPFADVDPRRPFHWMSYLVPVAARNDHETELLRLRSGPLDALLLSLPRWLTGRNVYYCRQPEILTQVHVLLNRLAQGDLRDAFRYLCKAAQGHRFRVKRMVFDNGLEIGPDGRIECLEFCPNATVRGGRLVPVCLADHLIPSCAPPT